MRAPNNPVISNTHIMLTETKSYSKQAVLLTMIRTPSDLVDIRKEREKRLEELLFVTKDPLLTRLGKFDPQLQSFSKKFGDIQHTLDESILGDDDKTVEDSVIEIISEQLYTNKSKKRKAQQQISGPIKQSKLIPDIIESVNEKNNKLLSKDITELEVLSIPENYPTEPHNVSSLAELYYLTQTLPLIKLLPGSHKALMTDNFESALLEGKLAVLYSRIEELKRQGKWSLRQPAKHQDPFIFKKTPPKTHWSSLLKEGDWLATDFKEQTKYKKACCFSIAQAILDYWNYGKEVCCIKTREIEHIDPDAMVEDQPEEEVDTKEADEKIDIVDMIDELKEQKTEEGEVKEEEKEGNAIKDANTETASEAVLADKDPSKTLEEAQAIDIKELLRIPTGEEQVVIPDTSVRIPAKVEDKTSIFKLHVDLNDMKKLDQSIVRNLPKFTAFDDEDVPNVGSKPLKPETQIIPVSKLLYPYDDDEGFFKIVVKEKKSEKKPYKLPEYQKGIFGTQSHRRFNYLKPPKPPLIKNIEYRSPTIWLPQDDKYLIHYVAEFCFNWDLISEHLLSTVASMRRYESNIERRTPWQCFERYIQLNEKFQFGDMKGPYSYHAQQWLEQAHRAQSTTKRRISPLGIGNDSIQRGHRRLRWASMFDAMRKCMRKRENQIAKMNSRRATEAAPQLNVSKNDKVPTPAELSKLKFERDKSIQEAYLNQQATRNRMMAAVAQQQKQPQKQPTRPPSAAGRPEGVNAPSGSTPTENAMSQGKLNQGVSPTSNSGQQANQAIGSMNRAITTDQGIPVNTNGTSYTPEQLQKLMQIQKQRRMMQNQGQFRNVPGQGGAQMGQQPKMDGQGKVNNITSPMDNQMMDLSPQNQISQMNKPGSSASPLMGTRAPPVNKVGSPQGQLVQPTSNNDKPRIQFAPAQVSAIINSIQQKHPDMSKEQVTKLAAAYLANISQQQLQRHQRQRQPNQAGPSNSQNPQQFQRKMQGQPQSTQPPTQQQQQTNQMRMKQQQQQMANLSPQERNQLQMLKAKQQQMQQQQMRQMMSSAQQIPSGSPTPTPQQLAQQQQMLAQQQRNNGGSPIMSNQGMNPANSKMDYEQRKRILMQKHQMAQQQQLQQQQYKQRMNKDSNPDGSSSSSN